MSRALWRKIQDRVGAVADGDPGDETARLIAAALGLVDAPPPAPGQFEPRTEQNIATLIPAAQVAARRFMEKAIIHLLPKGLEPRIISGTRTYAEQDALYAIGRTKEMNRQPVTKARGGYSNHNFGVAFDVGLFKAGKYLGESPHYASLGPVGEEVGLSWGGRWAGFTDKPHFEYKTGFTLAQMRERKAQGKPIA